MNLHPFVNDLSDKSTDELLESISTLGNKLQYMFKIGKHDMVRQIQMVLEAYRSEYQKRQNEIWAKKSQNLEKKIDIS
jgi:hypothetical protein